MQETFSRISRFLRSVSLDLYLLYKVLPYTDLPICAGFAGKVLLYTDLPICTGFAGKVLLYTDLPICAGFAGWASE